MKMDDGDSRCSMHGSKVSHQKSHGHGAWEYQENILAGNDDSTEINLTYKCLPNKPNNSTMKMMLDTVSTI